jgi:hypothetical protein
MYAAIFVQLNGMLWFTVGNPGGLGIAVTFGGTVALLVQALYMARREPAATSASS